MIQQLLKKENIFIQVPTGTADKEGALKKISELCCARTQTAPMALYRAFMEREAIDTTAFGEQLAIPHARVKELKDPLVAVVRFKEGIDWQAPDGQKILVAIALVMPKRDEHNIHLTVLSKFARKLVHPEFMEMLLKETDQERLYQYIVSEMEE